MIRGPPDRAVQLPRPEQDFRWQDRGIKPERKTGIGEKHPPTKKRQRNSFSKAVKRTELGALKKGVAVFFWGGGGFGGGGVRKNGLVPDAERLERPITPFAEIGLSKMCRDDRLRGGEENEKFPYGTLRPVAGPEQGWVGVRSCKFSL